MIQNVAPDRGNTLTIPDGAPASLCLYGEVSREIRLTQVYLCNGTHEALLDVTVEIAMILMFQYYNRAPETRWDEDDSSSIHFGTLPAGERVLVNELSHDIWDLVYRYTVTFRNADGERWQTEVDDLYLNACRLSQYPQNVWVAFPAARRVA
jgi:hypothetical protein